MAIDEWLISRARETGTGVVRLYSWSHPTVSLGRHQRARGAFVLGRTSQLELVRRLTGGRALVHHREITYSVTAPESAGTLKDTYARINALLSHTLQSLGVCAEVVPIGKRIPPPEHAPCFELPAPGELTVKGLKLVGSAQYREAGAFLQHGSVLIHNDQQRLQELAIHPVPPTPAATLFDELAREVSVAEFAAQLRAALVAEWDGALETIDPRVALAESTPYIKRYQDPEWTWRR